MPRKPRPPNPLDYHPKPVKGPKNYEILAKPRKKSNPGVVARLQAARLQQAREAVRRMEVAIGVRLNRVPRYRFVERTIPQLHADRPKIVELMRVRHALDQWLDIHELPLSMKKAFQTAARAVEARLMNVLGIQDREVIDEVVRQLEPKGWWDGAKHRPDLTGIEEQRGKRRYRVGRLM